VSKPKLESQALRGSRTTPISRAGTLYRLSMSSTLPDAVERASLPSPRAAALGPSGFRGRAT
jgi:hypothetical protein